MADTIEFPGAAVEKLASDVHDPIFFEKLASDWNIHPRTSREREQLLETALVLRQAKDAENIKQASAGNDFLTGALDSLKVALGNRGYNTVPSDEAQAIKQAAVRAAQSQPELVKAAADYSQYMAAVEAGQAE